MKKLFTCLACVGAFAAVSTPGHAQVATGLRIEAIAGFDHIGVNLDDEGIPDNLTENGLFFGGGVGFDVALGPQVAIGADLEATEAHTDFQAEEGGDSAELSVGRDLYAGVRLTVPITAGGAETPMGNFYVKGGYTNLRLRGTISFDGDTQSEATNLDGLRAGIGLQFAIGASSYIGAEYRYSNYEADVYRHQGALTFGFRF